MTTFSTMRQLMLLPARRKSALALAVWHLLCARLAFAVLPASELLRRLRQQHTLTESEPSAPSADAEVIAWAIRAAAWRMPWRTDCLIQAVAARRWLDRRHIASTFHIAAQGQDDSKSADADGLSAHVWLEVGGEPVTGGTLSPDLIRFAEI